jgi:hypothetical protein
MTYSIPSLRITDTFSFGEEKDGEWLVIECEDLAGKRFTLRIPHEIELGFFARFQAASIMAAGKRGSAPARDVESAMFVERITFGVTKDGNVGLTVQLAMGLVLDMALSDEAVDHFKQALADLDAFRTAGGKGLSH